MTDLGCYAPTAMAEQGPEGDNAPIGDPWHAFGYLVAGVGFYGLLGWLADHWFGTSFLVGIGILLGAVLGVYLTWSRFKQVPEPPRLMKTTDPNDVTNQEMQ